MNTKLTKKKKSCLCGLYRIGWGLKVLSRVGSTVLLHRGWSCPKPPILTLLEVTPPLRDAGTTFQFHCFYEIPVHLLKSDLPFHYSHSVQLLPPVYNLRGNSPHSPRSTSLSEDICYFSFFCFKIEV